MNITRKQIVAQYERAKRLLWVEHFREAANTITHGFFDTADLMAIGSRETNLDPQWLRKPGDRGNGFGLMQADKRSFPEFTKGDGWKDARTGILFGAKVLMQKWADMESGFGVRRSVKSSKTGKSSSYTGKHASGVVAQQIAIASYNAGRWPQYSYSQGGNPDQYTTGKDYSSDVMARARVFRELLAKDGLLDYTPKASAESSSTSGESEIFTEGSTSGGQADPSRPQVDAPPVISDHAPAQVAENITNVNQGSTVPENFEPEDKTLPAPPPAGILGKAKAWLIGLGLGVPTFGGITETAKTYFADGTISATGLISGGKEIFVMLLPYIAVVGIGFLALWGIKELLKQASFMLQMYLTARGDMHNVHVIPQPKQPIAGAWRFVQLPGRSAPPSVVEPEKTA